MKKIGITCHLEPDGSFGIWSNSIRQTAFFLFDLLSKNGHDVKLMTGVETVPTELQLGPNFVLPLDKITEDEDCDLLLIVGTKFSSDRLGRMRTRNPDMKVVLYKGYDAASHTMQAICSLSEFGADNYEDANWYDEVWIPSHYCTFNAQWAEIMYRVPVRLVTPVWSPIFMPEGFEYLDRKFDGTHSPITGPKYRVSVMEPNTSVGRTCHWPLMAIASAGLERIESVDVLNADHLLGDKSFLEFTKRLGFFGAAKAGFPFHVRGRPIGPKWMRDHCDVIVSHDLDASLNYNYFEALYGGYALVHTSEYIKDVGYFYNRYDAGAGGLALMKAMTNHDAASTRKDFMELVLPQLQDYPALAHRLNTVGSPQEIHSGEKQ